jgi:hemolysin D
LQPISSNGPATADKASVQEQPKAAVSEETRTHALLKLLSKEKLLTQVLRGLEADFALKNQLQSEWKDISAKLSKLDAEATRRQAEIAAVKASTKRIQLSADSTKAIQRQKQTQLTSPVDGTVQQLAVHSVGGVVTSAQALMIIVPDSTQVTAEVKLETFSYTKYGTVSATVDNVTADAVTDEKKGSYYPATLMLSQKNMLIDGKRIPLSPGMNVSAEIKTGKRRIIEFLLSPVQRAGSESLRER